MDSQQRFGRNSFGKIPKQIKIIILFVLLAAIAAVFFVLPKNSSAGISKVCFGDNCFSVEIAETKNDRTKGLMHRQSLPENSGMLFIFGREGIYPFWMKTTLIPLDMIWLDGKGRVVFIKQNAEPCTTEDCGNIIPDKKAKYVLEISGGLTEKLGIKTGNTATFRH
jgi:hypothetical protein